MDVLSVCSLRAGSLLWMPRPSTWVLTVVCKATYSLRPGEATLAPEQELPNEEDDHWNDDPGRSVRAPSDLLPVKPRPEVLLVGNAFAPGGVPARSITARLTVGDLDKAIEIWCDRSLSADGSVQEGGPVARMPLIYERAAGGPGTWNPVGIRPDTRDPYNRRVLPNLQVPGVYAKTLDEPIEPAGFGPLGKSWPTRIEKLGRSAALFATSGFRDRPLPEGIDLSYFNQAPLDQQLATLRDNERLVLENLHPERPLLATALPGIHPAAFVDRGRGPGQRLVLRADTLWIDTDRSIATLTWRGQLPLERADEPGQVLIGMEPPGMELTWAEVERARGGNRRVPMMTVLDEHTSIASIPSVEEELGGTVMGMPVTGPGAALPFAGARNDAPKRDSRSGLHPGLPFQATAPAPAPRPSSPGSALPFQSTPSAGSSAAWPAATSTNLGDSAVFRVPAPVPPVAPAPVTPAPPAVAPAPIESSPWASGAASAAVAPPPVTPAPPAVFAAPAPDSTLGVNAASNAAALASTAWSARPAPAPASSPLPTVSSPVRPSPRMDSREIVHLVWYDIDSVPRIRRRPAFRPILEELESVPLDADLGDPALAKDPAEMEDRRDVFEILARGPLADAEGVSEALTDAVREDGKLVPPVVLVSGEITFPFDELETLKATVTTVTPLVGPNDETLRVTVELAKDFLRTPGLLSAPAVAEGLTSRIKDAFNGGKRMVPAGYLEAQTERVLLEHRHYQKRSVLGKPHLRGLISLSGSATPIPAYLPADVAALLPLFPRWKARLCAEVRLPEDHQETQPSALRVLAIARTAPRR
jgi:hypothetical protein